MKCQRMLIYILRSPSTANMDHYSLVVKIDEHSHAADTVNLEMLDYKNCQPHKTAGFFN